MRTGCFALAAMLAFGASTFTTGAQDSTAPQQDALAAASRRALEAKKDQAPTAKVFTNDNLPTNAKISFVGQTPAAPTASASAQAQPAAGNSGDDAKKSAAANAALESAKDHLASLKKDLDLDQRRLSLDQQTYQSDPNHDSNKSGEADVQAEKDEIASKQDEVDTVQKLVDDLAAKASQAGSASSSSSSDNSANSASSSSDINSSAPAAPAVTTGGISRSTQP